MAESPPRVSYVSIIVKSVALPSRSVCEAERGDSIGKCNTPCPPICNSSSCEGRWLINANITFSYIKKRKTELVPGTVTTNVTI